MALGFSTTAAYGNLWAAPDKGLSRQTQHRVITQSFGDGYEQRLLDGINTQTEKLNVNFANRTKEEINDIAGFLNSTKNVTAFNFNVPLQNGVEGEETIKVVCENFSVNYQYDNYYSLTASLKRVYE